LTLARRASARPARLRPLRPPRVRMPRLLGFAGERIDRRASREANKNAGYQSAGHDIWCQPGRYRLTPCIIGLKRYIRSGLVVSVIGHLGLLIVGLLLVSADASHPPPDQAKPTSASAPIARAPSSAPESANNNSAKRKCRRPTLSQIESFCFAISLQPASLN
jgi:hypothetical protein